jgi:hypothetical protein
MKTVSIRGLLFFESQPATSFPSFSGGDRYFLSFSAYQRRVLRRVVLFFPEERDKIFLAFSQLKRDLHHQGFMSPGCGAKVELNFTFHDPEGNESCHRLRQQRGESWCF